MPWVVAALLVAVLSVTGAAVVRGAVESLNRDRFDIAANAFEAELADRISGFRIVTTFIPVAMSPAVGGLSLGDVESLMEGRGPIPAGAIATIMSSFPLDGFSAMAFVERDRDGTLVPSMLPNTAGLTADSVLSPAVADTVRAALESGVATISEPFTTGGADYRYVHVVPVSDRLAAVAFINAPLLVNGSLDNAGAQLLHVSVSDEASGVVVVDPGETPHPDLARGTRTSLLGRSWQLTSTPGPDFAWQSPAAPSLATMVMGLLIALLVYVVGIQTRRRSHQQEEQLRLARAVSDDKDRFIAAVSHELRTPLTSIVGLAAEIADAPDSFALEEIGELSRIVAQQSNEMSMLVEDLLVAARTQAGTVTVQPGPIELTSQIRMVVDGLGEHAERVTVTGDRVMAWADQLRVRQIVRNLITNAMRHGGPHVTVTAAEDATGSSITVCDDGPGVHGEARRRMFEPYYRSTGVTGQAPSVGLGLSVARELAVLMDGNITYHHEPGRSTFRLSLPTVLVDQPAAAGEET
jgi:signal transduction histidine kinase